jgi:hypothetical protein
MGIEFATISLKTEELLPEQKLWRGVLVNALEDTLIKQSDRKSSIYKVNAHEWIMLFDENFEKVCYWSGFEPNKVKEKYVQAIEKGDITFNLKQIAWAKYYKQYVIYKKAKDIDSKKYHRKRLEYLRNSVKDATTALFSCVFITA